MADRGRDLTLSIISKANQFDLAPQATELENLGDSAADAATKVDKAFDRIQDASRTSMRQVDANLDKGKAGLDDFKNEAHSSGREAAASFSGGFDDITGFVQETAANAFGGFGKIGAGAGIAAAVGIGILTSAISAANEKLKKLQDGLVDLKIDGLDTTADRVKLILQTMRDEGDLERFASAAKSAGIDFGDYVRALATGGPELDSMKARLDNISAGNWNPLNQGAQAAYDLGNRLRDQEKASQGATTSTEAYKDAVGGIAQPANDAADGVDRFSGVQAVAAQRAQDYATDVDGVETSLRSVGEAASKLATDTKVTATQVADDLDAQTKAITDYAKNLRAAARRGDEEFLAWVTEQPKNVAAAYASGTAKERDAIYAAWKKNVGAAQGEGIVDGTNAKKPAVTAVARDIRSAVEAYFSTPISQRVRMIPPSPADLAPIQRDIQAALAVTVNPYVSNARYAPGG